MVHIASEVLRADVRASVERAARAGEPIAIDVGRETHVYVAGSADSQGKPDASKVRQWLERTKRWAQSPIAQERARNTHGRDWKREDLYDPELIE